MRLLLRAVDLDLRGSGHSELGVARLQALMEWHLFSPAAVGAAGGAGGMLPTQVRAAAYVRV